MVQEPAVYIHGFPQYSQGKKAIWNSIHNTHKDEPMAYLDHFPECLIKSKNAQDMRIQLWNGAVYQIMGLDGKNARLARGMNPKYVILSEYAYMDPESWYTIEPRVKQNGGQAIFLSTPNGQNHFYHLYNHAISTDDPDFYGSLISNDHTHIHTPESIDRMREEGRPEDFIQQELFCSFTRGAEGSYYGKLIQKARDEGRICPLSISSDLPVHTAWDIGIGDSTGIFIFQTLRNGLINVLEYYENNNEGLPHYLHYLDEWKTRNKAVFGTHYVPHDMQNREFTSGVDRMHAASEMGYQMTVIPKKSLAEGIDAVRSLLTQCNFDQNRCKRGIECLDFYRKKWNESLKVYYDEPLHDRHSHGADAFRYLAIGVKGIASSSKMTAESIAEMRRKHYGY